MNTPPPADPATGPDPQPRTDSPTLGGGSPVAAPDLGTLATITDQTTVPTLASSSSSDTLTLDQPPPLADPTADQFMASLQRGPTIGPITGPPPGAQTIGPITDPTRRPGLGGQPAGSPAELGYVIGAGLDALPSQSPQQLGLDGTPGGVARAVVRANVGPVLEVPAAIDAAVRSGSFTSQQAIDAYQTTGLAIAGVAPYALMAGAALRGAGVAGELGGRTGTGLPNALRGAPVVDVPPAVADVPPAVADVPPAVADVPPAVVDVPPVVADVPLPPRAVALQQEAVLGDVTAPELVSAPDGRIVSGRTGLDFPQAVPDGFRPDGTVSRNAPNPIVCNGEQPWCGSASIATMLPSYGVQAPMLADVANESAVVTVEQTGHLAIGTTNEVEAQVLKNLGLKNATVVKNLTIDDVRRLTEHGPMLATIDLTPDVSHTVVLDGITRINGQEVAAIRNPWGDAYFQLLSEFTKSFAGNGVAITP
jgi:hypothetical protein